MSDAHGGERALGQSARRSDGRICDHRSNQVRVLGLGIEEVGGAVEAEKSGDLAIGER